MAEEQPQCPVMTTAAGVPVAANRNSLPAGARAPAVELPLIIYTPHTARTRKRR